jgi:hypothetical protein
MKAALMSFEMTDDMYCASNSAWLQDACRMSWSSSTSLDGGEVTGASSLNWLQSMGCAESSISKNQGCDMARACEMLSAIQNVARKQKALLGKST